MYNQLYLHIYLKPAVQYVPLDVHYGFFEVLQLKKMCAPSKVCVQVRAHMRIALLSQCSCVSAADLSVLRQRRKIGMSSRT